MPSDYSIEVFLQQEQVPSPTIDVLVEEIREQHRDAISHIHAVGRRLLHLFWVAEPQFASPDDLHDEPHHNGVYFNGKNIAEFHEQIRAGQIPFWKKYSGEIGITDPEKLMQKWLEDNGRTQYNFQRTPEEIVAQQYLGSGGGCGEYVSVMTDTLRAMGIPTKIIFFLKQNEQPEKDEPTRISQGIRARFGHYMGACYVAGKWRLFDFKWQWNPKFSSFYHDAQEGLHHLNHRNSDGTTYLPVTNDRIYTPGEDIFSSNVGFPHHTDLPDFRVFTTDFLKKMES